MKLVVLFTVLLGFSACGFSAGPVRLGTASYLAELRQIEALYIKENQTMELK